MPIVVNLDVMLAMRKKKSKKLAAYVGITEQNISLMHFSSLQNIEGELIMRLVISILGQSMYLLIKLDSFLFLNNRICSLLVKSLDTDMLIFT